MNLTLQQLQQLFDDKQPDSEPHTPMFVGKSGSLDKFDFLIKQIDDVTLSNQDLAKEIEISQLQLNEKTNLNGNIERELRELEQQLQQEIKHNKLLTQNYIRKHEACFELKKQLMSFRTATKQVVTISDFNNPRPSDCSTAPSPGMQANMRRAKKKAISCRLLEFEV